MKKGGLSFGGDDDDEEEEEAGQRTGEDGSVRVRAISANTLAGQPPGEDSDTSATSAAFKKKSLRPNASVGLQPKALTKSALLREAQLKDALRKEYIQIQEAVKATEFILPFVFYNGKNAPGGKVRLKKGDFVWLFLERARKVGAELGKVGERGRKDWARISVDDLMVVKGDLILTHVSNNTHDCIAVLYMLTCTDLALRLSLLLPQQKHRLQWPPLQRLLLRRAHDRNAQAPSSFQRRQLD